MKVHLSVLPVVYFPTVAFTVLVQLCDPKAIPTEMGVTLFTKILRARTSIFTLVEENIKNLVVYTSMLTEQNYIKCLILRLLILSF